MTLASALDNLDPKWTYWKIESAAGRKRFRATIERLVGPKDELVEEVFAARSEAI